MSEKNYYYIRKCVKKFRQDVQNVTSRDESVTHESSLPCSSSNVVDLVRNNAVLDLQDFSSAESSSNKGTNVIISSSDEITNSDDDGSNDSIPISDVCNSSFSLDSNSDTESNKIIEKKDESVPTNNSLRENLKVWAIQHNITLTAVSSLLKIMHEFHPHLPLDARTLLETKASDIEKITDKSEFAYFGVGKTIRCLLEKETNLKEKDLLELNIHFDGIPIYKSSSVSFWPILCSIHDTSLFPFAIAIYYSDKKPDINIYLSKFCSEMKELMATGIEYENKIYQIKLRVFIADAPAKSFVKQIKQHGGYYACTHCTVKGIYDKTLKSMSYNEVNASLRTDETFRIKEQPQHHIGKSPLEQLDIDMVLSFPIDYMHLVLLGVMRKLLNIWLNKLPYKISSTSKNLINEGLVKSKKFLPLEFHRRPRELNHIDRWKATEFRTFLLYVGCLVLKDNISEKFYHHFLMLVCSIRILCNQNMIRDIDLLNYAKKLNLCFVKRFRLLYNNCSTVYNVHGLLHIANDVEKFGNLDSYSAFPFETFLGVLKTKVHSGWKPLAQVCRRLSEVETITRKGKLRGEKSDDIIINDNIIVPGIFKDSCILLHDQSVCLVMAKSKSNVTVKKFARKSALFTKPCDSSILEMYKVSKKSEIMEKQISEIKCKCFIYPRKSSYAVIPLL